MAGMDWAVLVVSVALVVATSIYAVFTWLMVSELRATRALSVRPRLGLSIRMVGPAAGYLGVTNVGPGTALDVDVTLRFDPVGEQRPWRALVMSPNERAEIALPTFEEGKSQFEIGAAAGAGAEVHMTGTTRNVYGEAERVEERISIAEWWNVVSEADQRFVEEPTDQALKELKKARESLWKLASDVHRLTTRDR